MRKSCYLLLIFIIAATACKQKTDNPLTTLKEERIHSLNLYFYPSTVRMINVTDDTTFYKATKNIERVQYLSVDLAEDRNDSIYQAWYAQLDLSRWDELFQASSSGNLTAIYAPKEADNKYLAYIKTGDGVNLIWAEGEIDLSNAMALMNGDFNLGPVSSFLDNKSKEEKRREVWKKVREEQRILEEGDSTDSTDKTAL